MDSKVHRSEMDDLLLAFQPLDRRLERAVALAQAAYGAEASQDPYRGLYIDATDLDRAFGQELGTSVLQADSLEFEVALAERVSQSTYLTRLQTAFDLTVFDLGLIVIALAPELDLRYERIYAYLQDDVTRKRPSVDLALNLLCASAADKLARRFHFAPAAPLMQQGLLQLIPDANQVQPPLLTHFLKLDDQIVRWLLGQPGLDARLQRFGQLQQSEIALEHLSLSQEIKQALERLTVQAWQRQEPLWFYFQGSQGVGKKRSAAALAHHLNLPLLSADLLLAWEQKLDLEALMSLLVREAKCQPAVLYLSRVDEFCESGACPALMAGLKAVTGICILAGRQPAQALRESLNLIQVDFSMPNFAQRHRDWQLNLSQADIHLQAEEVDLLSDRFRLSSEQIAGAIATAEQQARWQQAITGIDRPLTLPDLIAATRQQSGQALASLARKISPQFTWDDLILPAEQQLQLREICSQVQYHPVVGQQWGFDQKLSLGKGVNVLFSGSPGTGKTMSAEVIANQLQLDIYKIDLSQIVSKYIGETEKNLDRVFTAAATANAILLFDEADALFGKRSEVKDAHDRYANLEIAYLLQKMEEYEGITILTTNLRQNLDEAFTRRIRFIVEFPFPEAADRLQIWQGMFPQQMPLSADVNLEQLAEQFKLAGGSIRNIALAAAFLAAENGQSVGMKHLLQATRREFQKMGRLINEEEFLK